MVDAQLNIATLLLAVGAGILSFASPCVLPLLPSYLGYITGFSAEQLSQPRAATTQFQVVVQSIAFVAGLAVVFTLLGASASILGRILLRNLDLVSKVGGLIVIVFGLHTLSW